MLLIIHSNKGDVKYVSDIGEEYHHHPKDTIGLAGPFHESCSTSFAGEYSHYRIPLARDFNLARFIYNFALSSLIYLGGW